MEEEREAMTVREFCKRYTVSHTVAYAEMSSGRLPFRRLRRRRLIPVDGAREWFDALPTYHRYQKKK